MPLAQRAVDLAKDTIHYLTRLNSQTNLYRKIQVLYHQFLTSAIAVLFLAATHYPMKFSPECRAEFYMALELVRDFSGKSWVSQRLWRTIRNLKNYAPQLGLNEDGEQESGREQFRRATQTLSPPVISPGSDSAGRHTVPTIPLPSPLTSMSRHTSSSATPPSLLPQPSTSTPAAASNTPDASNGDRLQTEMSRIFEGYLGMSTAGIEKGTHPLHQLPAYIRGAGLSSLQGSHTPSPGPRTGSFSIMQPPPSPAQQGELAAGGGGNVGNGNAGFGGMDGGGVFQSFKQMF
jgi:hypothetical protein